MANVAIMVENLSKRYEIATAKLRHDTLRDQIADSLRRAFRPSGCRGRQSIWVLRNISFTIEAGEVLGVIGHNGAGKSTLLKILSRITEPTQGRAEIHGRVGSLLEVGTGFHPELTGRENIYLNGAILGMKKAEIECKFDEIVAFAETEQFIDTPVKRYSSGMYLRLAFAVAAHLDPEILIVDEVLAVGDVQFQKKCIGKMQDISRGEGRTILFVSHNMDAIRRLCSRCLLLSEGKLVANGNTAAIVEQYLYENEYRASPNEWIDVSQAPRRGTGEARFAAVQYSSGEDTVGFQPYPRGPLEFVLAVDSDGRRPIASIAVALHDLAGTRLVNADTLLLDREFELEPGRNWVTLRIEKLYLNPGIYRIVLWLANPHSARSATGVYDYLESAFEIEVVGFGEAITSLNPNAAVTCRFELVNVQHVAGNHKITS